jgi:histidine ammonia-lyase
MADPAQMLHIPPGNGFAVYLAGGGGFTPVDLEQEIQSLTNPIAPSGQAIVATVEDLQAQTRIKAYRARQAVSTTFDLLGQDLLTASLWLDVRKAQDPSRNFGDAPTAAWTAFRKVVPTLPTLDGIPSQSRPMAAAAFLRSTPAGNFYTGAPMPRSAENPSE